MSQSSISIANGAGVIVRAAINAALEALATCNSGATEPSVTYPNMLWFDTSAGLLKRRNNANTDWEIMSLEAVDTDVTLAANSDTKIASQKAGKTYADTKISKTTTGEINAMTEKTTLADNDLFLIEDSAASNAKKKVKKSNIAPALASQAEAEAGTDNVKMMTALRTAQAIAELSTPAAYVVGDTLLHSHDTEDTSQTTRSTWVKKKEITLNEMGGNLRVKFDAAYGGDDGGQARLYKNGVAIGTARTPSGGGSYTTYSEDITGLVVGDKLQIYVYNNAGSGGDDAIYIKNFRLYHAEFTNS